jgi:hypothetical protein
LEKSAADYEGIATPFAKFWFQALSERGFRQIGMVKQSGMIIFDKNGTAHWMEFCFHAVCEKEFGPAK